MASSTLQSALRDNFGKGCYDVWHARTMPVSISWQLQDGVPVGPQGSWSCSTPSDWSSCAPSWRCREVFSGTLPKTLSEKPVEASPCIVHWRVALFQEFVWSLCTFQIMFVTEGIEKWFLYLSVPKKTWELVMHYYWETRFKKFNYWEVYTSLVTASLTAISLQFSSNQRTTRVYAPAANSKNSCKDAMCHAIHAAACWLSREVGGGADMSKTLTHPK